MQDREPQDCIAGHSDTATDTANNASTGTEEISEPVPPFATERTEDSQAETNHDVAAKARLLGLEDRDLKSKPELVEIDYPSDVSSVSGFDDVEESDDELDQMYRKRHKLLASSVFFAVMTARRLRRLETEMSSLETEMRKLKAEGTGPRPASDNPIEEKINQDVDPVWGDKPGPSKPDDPLSIHAPPPGMTWETSILRVDREEFRKRSGFKSTKAKIKPFLAHGQITSSGAPEPTRHVIEVLMENQQTNIANRKLRQKMAASAHAGPSGDDPLQPTNLSGTNIPLLANDHLTLGPLNIESAAMGMSAHKSPSCVRIRSKAVATILRRLSGVTHSANDADSLVIRKPFKILVTFESNIRSHLKDLERLHKDKGDDRAREPDSETTAKRKLDETMDLGALRDMRLLVEFMDNDLGAMFKTRAALAAGTQTTVTFEDLWHLFYLGQEVTTQVDGSEAYQVLKFGGGRVPSAALYPSQKQSSSSYDIGMTPRTFNERVRTNPSDDFQRNWFFVGFIHYWMNGKSYIPSISTQAIMPFDGERKITDLPIFPLKFVADWEAQRARLMARGTRLIDLCNNKETVHKQYIGWTTPDSNGISEDIDSQIIVDYNMYCKMEKSVDRQPGTVSNITKYTLDETSDVAVDPDCSKAGCCANDYILKDYDLDQQIHEDFLAENPHMLESTDNPDELDEGDRLLLPSNVYGFILRSRKWAVFRVELVKDLSFSNGFDDLVLPNGHKDSVRALVTNHLQSSRKEASLEEDIRHKTTTIDLVRNKGKGLIILLHGQPGVGKTSTAECVADYAKRPLYPITCGDIGDNATTVEANLEKNFSLARKWDCVLLLDEADVFLSKRDRTDFKRNAIISVFLRTLEYYSGILFLTTNRVGTFDPAFKSRIHISLYYPDLDRNATLAIWKMHLGRVRKAQGKNFLVDDKDIIAFAKDHYKSLIGSGSGSWNGRQIRNCFQTALALAEFEGKENAMKLKMDQVYIELKREHFKKVAEASQTFDHYLKVMFGGKNESELAAAERVRAQLPMKDSNPVVKVSTNRKTVLQKAEFEEEDGEGEDDNNDHSDDVVMMTMSESDV